MKLGNHENAEEKTDRSIIAAITEREDDVIPVTDEIEYFILHTTAWLLQYESEILNVIRHSIHHTPRHVLHDTREHREHVIGTA